jgi:hypothetical protein
MPTFEVDVRYTVELEASDAGEAEVEALRWIWQQKAPNYVGVDMLDEGAE